MNFHRLIFFCNLLLSVLITNAQDGVTIKAMVDKNRILIGEPFRLTIEARLSRGSVISFLRIDSIEHFEFLNKPIIDSIQTNEGRIINSSYKITSFDSGHWVIPSFFLAPSIKTDTIPMDVVFSEFDPNQDYHGLKDIIEAAPTKRKPWWWYIAGSAILLSAVAFYLWRKKKPASLKEPEERIDPFIEAMKQLELLEKAKPGVKKYYSELIDIFRLYVYRKKGILSLQKTTADLVLKLRDLELGKEQLDNLSQALRLSDFVKFAKYVPTTDDDKHCFEEIKYSIMTIEQSESGPPAFGGS